MLERVPDIHTAPRLWGALTAVSCIAIFLVFIALGQPQRGIISMFAFGVVFLSFALFWEYRVKRWFWVLAIFISMAHILFVFFVDWSFEKRPGLYFALMAAIDAIVIFVILNTSARLFGRK